jgi:hypothetical protein
MSILKKIPLWAKILFPVGLLFLVIWFLRDRGRGAWPWANTPSRPVGPAAPPSITPEEAEEKREEIKEETATEKEAIKEKYDKEREDMEKWLRGDS